MRKHQLVLCLLLLLVFTILQTTLVPRVGGLLKHVDLVLVWTTTYALLLGPSQGAALGLGAGLLRGIVSGPTLGIYGVALYIIGYCVGQFSRLMYRFSRLVPLVVGMVATVANWLLMTLLVGGFYGFWIGGRFWLGLPIAILLNGFLTAVSYALLSSHHMRPKDTKGRGEADGRAF